MIKGYRKNVAEAITNSGYTRGDIRRLTGLNLNQISGFRSGALNPTKEQAETLAKLFKKPSEYLFEMQDFSDRITGLEERNERSQI